MKKIDIDPKSIKLEEAYCMCSHTREYFAPENEGKQLTYKSNGFPLVIDFDELDRIEPPSGYVLNKANRDIEIRISTFSGYCPGAKHYYCDIKFEGPTLKDEKDGFTYSYGKPKDKEVGDIFGFHKIELYRRLTENDLADKNIDWDYYDVGCMTHRWNDEVVYDIEDAALKLGYALATLYRWNDPEEEFKDEMQCLSH